MHQDAAHSSIVRTSDFIVSVALIAGGALEHTFLWDVGLPFSGALRIPAGLAVVGIGAALIVAGRRALSLADQPSKPGVPTTGLVTTGVFRYTRNPVYLGLAIVVLGLGIAANFVAWIALAGPVLIAMHGLLVRPEERYLREQFPEDFAAYASKVRRWI